MKQAAKTPATRAELVSEHPFAASGYTHSSARQPGTEAKSKTVRMFELPNGLRVLLLADPAAPVFAYQTWFRVGSRNERDGKTGIAHLFEHLMFNETEHLAHGEFDRTIELVGGNTNAATWVDWTYYQDDLPASELELIIKLEADRMQHLKVRHTQVETERGVVISERRLRVEDDVDGFMSEELFRLAFPKGHPYHWPTIGWMRDIKRLGLKDAMEFYRTYYAPNNATLVVVGDIDEKRTLALVEKYYGGIPRQTLPKAEASKDSSQREERRAAFSKPVTTDKLLIGYKAAGFTDPDFLKLELLNDVLLGGQSSPIYRDLVIEREIMTSLGGSVTPFRDPGLWEIGGSLQRGHSAEEAIAILDGHVAALHKNGVSDEDLSRARARMLTDFFTGLRTAHGKAASLGEYETTAGDYRALFHVPAALREITSTELSRIARRYLEPTRRTVLIARPQPEPPKKSRRASKKASPAAPAARALQTRTRA